MSLPVAHSNVTHSQWEEKVDNAMAYVEDKVGRFEKYAQSEEGQHRIAQVQFIAKFAAAFILAMAAPATVIVATGIGVVVRAFSADQLERVQTQLSRISNTLPDSVKALALVIAFTYTPILFPIVGGLCAGFEIGNRVSPQAIANGMDRAAAVVATPLPATEDNKAA